MNKALDVIRDALDQGQMGDLTYARFSQRHSEVDLGDAVGRMLGLAQSLIAPITKIFARGQWLGDEGALTLTLDHEGGAISLIDLSSASAGPSFACKETLLRIEGSLKTLEILEGSRFRLSSSNWRQEEVVEPLELSDFGDDPKTEIWIARAMQSAETGEAS